MGIPLLIIVGPTAIGKSKLALDLAIHFGGEIISGDSMQIYKGMNIGTAKLDNIKMHNIPHHLIDIKFPDDSFSVAEFQYMARKMIEDINSRSKLPIIAGGTGLYIQSVIDRYIFEEHKDFNIKNLRNELSHLADDQGVDALYNELLQIDPKSASKIHPNDKKRILRAIEYYHSTGKRLSEKVPASYQPYERYLPTIIGLDMLERKNLYIRIDKRVDEMLEDGLQQEVEALLSSGCSSGSSAMQGLGYRHMNLFLQNKCTLSEATAELKKDTRRFAKRQLTWFKKDKRVCWFHVDKYASYELMLKEIIDFAGRTIVKSVE